METLTLINIEDLKTWRAERIQQGNCNFDDMQALGAFIDRVEKFEVVEVRTDEKVALVRNS